MAAHLLDRPMERAEHLQSQLVAALVWVQIMQQSGEGRLELAPMETEERARHQPPTAITAEAV
jgi:hypothetical protein